MTRLTFKGHAVMTCGELPAVGSRAPFFSLVNARLESASLTDWAGQIVVLNIFPSLDTPVCAASVRRFNEAAAKWKNSVVLCVSVDLPFAMGRFCAAEGIENVVPLSDFRTGAFGRDYGVRLVSGPLEGLLARAVVMVNPAGLVFYTELVPEIAQEPDYEKALAVLAQHMPARI